MYLLSNSSRKIIKDNAPESAKSSLALLDGGEHALCVFRFGEFIHPISVIEIDFSGFGKVSLSILALLGGDECALLRLAKDLVVVGGGRRGQLIEQNPAERPRTQSVEDEQ